MGSITAVRVMSRILSRIPAWEAETLEFLRRMGFEPRGKALLLAVSGGADSMALLRFFAGLRPSLALRLGVAHVHHGLRPEADRDEDLVRHHCARLGIAFRLRRLDPSFRPPRLSVEMWAREARYLFFREVSAQDDYDHVLTAHHRDDLVETVLQRLARGTGPKGLQGLPFSRDGRIVRPFLSRSREEIREYLRLTGTPWREDASNRDVSLERNWFRHVHLPRLRSRMPRCEERIARMALEMQRLWPWAERMLLDGAEPRLDGSGKPFLPREALPGLFADPAGLKAALEGLLRLRRRAGPFPPPAGLPRGVTQRVLDESLRQWRQGRRLRVALAPGCRLVLDAGGLGCEIAEPPRPRVPGEWEGLDWVPRDGAFQWAWGGRKYTLFAKHYPRSEMPGFPGSGEPIALFDADLLSCKLRIRTRKKGDRFSPLGLASRSRKLKSFLNERKVPMNERDILPLVCNGAHVVWIPGYGISDFHKIGLGTRRVLEMVLAWENR